MSFDHTAYRQLYASVPVGLCSLDRNGQIASPNPALLHMLHASGAHELDGQLLQPFLVSDTGVDLTKLAAESGDILEGWAIQLSRLDGSRIWVTLRVWKESSDSQPAKYLACFTDISRIKDAETALAYAQSLLQEANRIKSAFLTKISHDLRTPLNSILGFSQLMIRDTNLTPDQITDLESINRNGRELLRRINDVLEYAKTESGNVHLREDQFRLRDLVSILQESLARRAMVTRLEFVLEVSPDLPDLVYGDEEKLRLVLNHLLDNAFKFTQNGSICLRVRSEDMVPGRIQPDECMFVFEVLDTGIGIAEDEIELIFEPFSFGRSKPSASHGIGLGLAISRQYVQIMRGQITVESIVGKGTCFSVHLPLKRVSSPDAVINVEMKTSTSEGVAPQENPEHDLPLDLPAAWKDEMHQAALLGDITNIMALIDMLKGDFPVFAAKLTDLAWRFEYGKIIDQLE